MVFVCGRAEHTSFEAHPTHKAALGSFVIDAIELLVLMREESVGIESGHFEEFCETVSLHVTDP